MVMYRLKARREKASKNARKKIKSSAPYVNQKILWQCELRLEFSAPFSRGSVLAVTLRTITQGTNGDGIQL